jgi:glycosyltransferase involved in cell wall biosynthesis
LGNYSRTLIGSLSGFHPEHEYWLYTPRYQSNSRFETIEGRKNISIITPSSGIAKVGGALWRGKLINEQIKNDGLDLFHGLSNELPFGIRKTGVKTLVTIHDMIFRRFPQFYPLLDRAGYRIKVSSACRNADAIIAVSEQTKQDIIEYEQVDPKNVHVVYQSCDESFTRIVPDETKPEVRVRYNLPQEFILYVGAIEERKNLLRIIKAIEAVPRESRPALVALGNGRKYKEQVEQYVAKHHLSEYVTILPDADFADFPAIYQMATLLVYPSIFEGFGIPIVEALWSRTPVITSQGGVFPEAGGPDSVCVDPHDVEALRDAIEMLVGDADRRAKMAESGHKYAQRFSREKVTREMMVVYEGLAGY